MALPTLIKSYTLAKNRVVGAQGSVFKTKMGVYLDIKNALIAASGSPWVVRYSCDARVDTGAVNAGAAGAAGDLVDRWTSIVSFAGTDGLGSPSAGRFPWIVLRQTGIATNFEMCIAGTTGQSMTVAFSPSAGFTGGSVAARPTATDEIIAINNTTAFDGNDTQHINHVWVSTDGQVTVIQCWRGSTNQVLFGHISKPQDVVSGWTNPSCALFLAATTGLAGTYALLSSYANRGRTAGTIGICLTGEGDRSGAPLLAEVTDIGTVANDLTGEWPFFGIGMASKTVGSKGRHGSVYDMWWKPISVADADTFPNDASNRQFVALGNVILPWSSDASIPLIT